MCGHYSVEWYTHGTLLLGATHLSLILIVYTSSLFALAMYSGSSVLT